MFSSRAWFVLVVGVLLSLFYLGHSPGQLPVSTAVSAEEPGKGAALKFQTIVSSDGEMMVRRAKVPGGWLVTAATSRVFGNNVDGVGLTFVPDAKHEWNGSSLP